MLPAITNHLADCVGAWSLKFTQLKSQSSISGFQESTKFVKYLPNTQHQEQWIIRTED